MYLRYAAPAISGVELHNSGRWWNAWSFFSTGCQVLKGLKDMLQRSGDQPTTLGRCQLEQPSRQMTMSIWGADGDIRSSKQGGGAFAEGTVCTVRLLLAFCQHLLLAKQTLGVGKAQHPKTRPAHLIFTVQGVEAKTLLTSLIHFAACFTVSLCTFIYYKL